MTTVLTAVATGAVLAGLVHALARAHVRKIRANPDPYPVAVLSQEPDGDDRFIGRPDGTRLRARVRGGHGPTIVFVHGFTGSVLAWNVIWPLLHEGGYRLIAYDHRGHGRSTMGADGLGTEQLAGDLRAVLEHFDVRDAILVGHSMGGFVAITFMLRHADASLARLRHCVLLSTFAGDILRGAPQNRFQILLLQTGILQRLVQTRTYGWAITAAFYGALPPPSGVEVYRRVLATQPLRPLIPLLRAMMAESYYPRLSEIRLPCTVMYGTEDRTSPAWHSNALHGGIAGSRLEQIEGVGHMLIWEAPARVTELIRSLAPHPDGRVLP
jgi:non-heme chloroperoxidase